MSKRKIIGITVLVILAIIVLYNHRENIKRILSGTENKLSFSKKN